MIQNRFGLSAQVGDVYEIEGNNVSMEVVEIFDTPACDFKIAGLDNQTVAEANPDYPADDRVIGIDFINLPRYRSATTYHYPETRIVTEIVMD